MGVTVGKEQVELLLQMLSKAVLSGESTFVAPADEGVYALAKRHRVSSCLYEEERNAEIKRQILFDAEREGILHRAKARNIPVLELKGNMLSKLYPAYGTHSFADVDLLIPVASRKSRLGLSDFIPFTRFVSRLLAFSIVCQVVLQEPKGFCALLPARLSSSEEE